MPMTSCYTLPCDTAAPQRARAWAQGQLGSASVGVADPLMHDTLLCISELVTNAVQASCDHVSLDLIVDRDRVRIVVTDNGCGWPTMHRPEAEDPHGRGLMIIDAIAQSWGIEPSGVHKAVWAELETV
jgi:anti-sigma regulatory factor (Ser/Thr protein kinase)